ncbi:addiction module protein [Undibacterium danionis]|uniref:Addiction module protein n=1 Tax=Undibacterium danionis TaxID=1812100 RepID=A0ABV6IF98_9BURK
MSLNLLELEQKASQLTADERAELALFLLVTLEPADSGDIESAWQIEAKSRLAEIKRGEATLVSAEDVFDKLHRQLN